LDEALQVITAMWTEPYASFTGDHYRAGTWCDNGGASLQPNANGAMAMSLNLTGCSGLNGTLQQILVWTSDNAYLDNIVVK
jgi:hypothetical protein